jgi:hypothetical protein
LGRLVNRQLAISKGAKGQKSKGARNQLAMGKEQGGKETIGNKQEEQKVDQYLIAIG